MGLILLRYRYHYLWMGFVDGCDGEDVVGLESKCSSRLLYGKLERVQIIRIMVVVVMVLESPLQTYEINEKKQHW